MDSLCLEKLYQSNFTVAKSSNGLSRLFLIFFQKNIIFQKRKSLWVAETKPSQNIRGTIYGKTKKTDLKVGLPPSRAVTALEQIPTPVLQERGLIIDDFRLMETYFAMKKIKKWLEEPEKENNE